MADQRALARLLVAVSSLIVAVCAVIVTIKVMGVISVKPQRVLDPAAVERQVTNELPNLQGNPASRVECPVSVVVEVNNRFSCRYYTGSGQATVIVMVVSDQGELSITTPG